MKLTGALKEKVDAANSKEEKRKILMDTGIELDDDEMELVTGGYIEGLVRVAAEAGILLR